jgi:hypothetical protein
VNGEPRSVPDRWSQRNEAVDMLRRRERLDADLALATDALEQAEEQARIEREKVALIQDRLARRTALLDELSMLADQENEAQALLRRAERKLDRRLHQRAAIDVQADRSRRGRMVKVHVDPTAWESYREFSRLRLFQVIGTSVGQLVAAEVELIRAGRAEHTPSCRRRRSPGEAVVQPVTKSLRIFVDEDLWPTFALHVSRGALTVGRYVGELVEAGAHDNGWRAQPENSA